MDYFTLQDLSEGQKGAGQQLGCCWTTGQMVGDKLGLDWDVLIWTVSLISAPADMTLLYKQLQSFDEMSCNNDENNANNTQLQRLKVCIGNSNK